MMNLNKITCLLALCVAVAFGSCSKKDSEALSSEELVSQNSVELSFEAEQQFVEDEEPRALEFSLGTEGTYQSLTHSETEVPVHIYLRGTTSSQPISVGTLKLTRTSGSKILKLKLGTLALSAGTDLSRGDWYIMGIIGGKRTNHVVTFEPSSILASTEIKSAGEKVKLDVPFVSQWVKVTFKRTGGTKPSVNFTEQLKFKPQGAVIRATAKNETGTAYSIKGYKLVSNTGTFSATLNPAEAGLNPATTPVTLNPDISATSVSGTFVAAQSLDANGRLNYFLAWSAPLKSQPVHKQTVFTLVTSDDKELKVYTSDKEIRDKYLMRLSGGIQEEAKLPLEFMAEYNLSASGIFATSNHGSRHKDPLDKRVVISDWGHSAYYPKTSSDPGISGVFKGEDIPTVAMPTGYRMPTEEDWHAIFTNNYTHNISAANGQDFDETYEGKSYISRAQTMNSVSPAASYGTEQALRAPFRLHSEAFVAIRFEKKPGSDQSDNKLRSAWLYEFVYAPEIHDTYKVGSFDGRVHPLMLKISAIKDQNSTLADIRKPTYWDTALRSGKAVVRYMPYLLSHDVGHNFGTPSDGVFYYSAPGNADFSFALNDSGPLYDMGVNHNHVFYGWGLIRPFKNK